MVCAWPINTTCAGEEWDNLDSDVQERALALASSVLHRLTGGRVGNCPVKVRPCTVQIGAFGSHPLNWLGSTPVGGYTGDLWISACGCMTASCSCDLRSGIRLEPPVGRIDEVKVDGLVLLPAQYRLHENRLLWTGPGPAPWRLDQNLSLPDTEPGTFSVTYLNAYPVDSMGECAVGVLAAEFAAAVRGKKCRLPSGVTAITRQGVTMEIGQGAFPNGLTGIREVDAYIALWNPRGLTHGSRVWVPR